MDLSEIRDDILKRCWVEYPAFAQSFLVQDAVVAINQAIQTLWMMPEDYWKKARATFNTVAAQSAYDIADTVQEISGPVTIAGNPLPRLSTRGDFDMFALLYEAGTATPGTPRAYYIERTKADDDQTDDPAKVQMLLTPTPTGAQAVAYYAINDAPIYTAADFCEDPPLELPIPHRYCETILLPLARYNITSSHLFWDKDKIPMLKEEADKALILAGLADPDHGTKQRTHNAREVAAPKA